MALLTRNELIEQALDIIGVKAAEEDAAQSAVNDSATALNVMIKRWQSTGPHLWKRDEATLFIQPAQIKYQIGNSSPDHVTADFSETTLSADAVATATTLSLTDSTGLSVDDNIGIKLDDGDLHWTTVTLVSPVTIAGAMPSLATSGNAVYFYTTDLEKALRIPDARRRQSSGVTAQEIEMIQLGRIDYLNLPNKNTSGTPVQFYYDPKQLSGNMYLWPAPTTVDTVIKFTSLRPFNGYLNSEDTGEFPDEWVEALIYNLAVRMNPRFGSGRMNQEDIDIADSSREDLLDWDQGDAPVNFQFSYGRGQ